MNERETLLFHSHDIRPTSHHGVSSPEDCAFRWARADLHELLQGSATRSSIFSHATSARSSSATTQVTRIGHQPCRLWRGPPYYHPFDPCSSPSPLQERRKINIATMQPQKLHRDEVAKVCCFPTARQHETSTNPNRQHNTEEDLWTIIDHKVYDLTDFIDAHPGGSVVLAQIAGTDSTEAFYNLHRHEVLQKYSSLCLGELEGEKSEVIDPQPGDLSEVPYAEPLWLKPESASPYYNDSHRRLQKAMRKFVDVHVTPEAREKEDDGTLGKFSLEGMPFCCERVLTGLQYVSHLMQV
jgi:hypothetical protein